jgi:hypothetical protein
MRVISLSRDRINGRTDRRGRQERIVAPDELPEGWRIMRLAGSPRKGSGGWVYHVVDPGIGVATCGRRPAPTSAGWVADSLVQAITCAKCAEVVENRLKRK